MCVCVYMWDEEGQLSPGSLVGTSLVEKKEGGEGHERRESEVTKFELPFIF